MKETGVVVYVAEKLPADVQANKQHRSISSTLAPRSPLPPLLTHVFPLQTQLSLSEGAPTPTNGGPGAEGPSPHAPSTCRFCGSHLLAVPALPLLEADTGAFHVVRNSEQVTVPSTVSTFECWVPKFIFNAAVWHSWCLSPHRNNFSKVY